MDLYLFEHLLAARDERQLERATLSVAEKLGFEIFCFALAYRRGGEKETRYFTFGNYPQAWLDRYFEQDYVKIDPTVSHCLRNTTPLIWSRDLFERHPAVIELDREARSFGIDGGCALPIHAPWLQGAGFLSLATAEDCDKAKGRVVHSVPAGLSLACYLSQAIRQIILPCDTAFRQAEELSSRELECLRWAAAGLPAKLISDRMGISTATVTGHHLPAIRRKLGAANTREAVSLAVYHGLICP